MGACLFFARGPQMISADTTRLLWRQPLPAFVGGGADVSSGSSLFLAPRWIGFAGLCRVERRPAAGEWLLCLGLGADRPTLARLLALRKWLMSCRAVFSPPGKGDVLGGVSGRFFAAVDDDLFSLGGGVASSGSRVNV